MKKNRIPIEISKVSPFSGIARALAQPGAQDSPNTTNDL